MFFSKMTTVSKSLPLDETCTVIGWSFTTQAREASWRNKLQAPTQIAAAAVRSTLHHHVCRFTYIWAAATYCCQFACHSQFNLIQETSRQFKEKLLNVIPQQIQDENGLPSFSTIWVKFQIQDFIKSSVFVYCSSYPKVPSSRPSLIEPLTAGQITHNTSRSPSSLPATSVDPRQWTGSWPAWLATACRKHTGDTEGNYDPTVV